MKGFWKWVLLFSVIDFLLIAGSIFFYNADHDGFIRFFFSWHPDFTSNCWVNIYHL